MRGVGGLEEEVSVPSSFSVIQDLSLLYDITIFILFPSSNCGENEERGPGRAQGLAGPLLIRWARRGLSESGRIGVRRRGFMCGKRLKLLLRKPVLRAYRALYRATEVSLFLLRGNRGYRARINSGKEDLE